MRPKNDENGGEGEEGRGKGDKKAAAIMDFLYPTNRTDGRQNVTKGPSSFGECRLQKSFRCN